MKLKSFDEFLNESYWNASTLDDYFNVLKRAHPRSSYTEEFINKVKDLDKGKLKEVPRSDFRLKMGTQWGLEFVDKLIEGGFLVKFKRGRKEFLTSIKSKEGIKNASEQFYPELETELLNKAWRSGNVEGVMFHYDKKLGGIVFVYDDWIMTWHHHEKGYGDVISHDERDEMRKRIENYLADWYIVKYALERVKERFGSSKFEIIKKEEGREKVSHHDGHRGIPYKITAIIKA